MACKRLGIGRTPHTSRFYLSHTTLFFFKSECSGVWGDSWVGKALAWQEWGVEFNPENPTLKKLGRMISTCDPCAGGGGGGGERKTSRSTGQAGLTYLLTSRCLRDSASKTNEDSIWRVTPRLDLWPLRANTAMHTHLYNHMHPLHTHTPMEGRSLCSDFKTNLFYHGVWFWTGWKSQINSCDSQGRFRWRL